MHVFLNIFKLVSKRLVLRLSSSVGVIIIIIINVIEPGLSLQHKNAAINEGPGKNK